MEKIEELKIELEILQIIKKNIEINLLSDVAEISLDGIENDIENIKAQINVLEEQDNEEIIDEDIREITTTTFYSDGKPIKIETSYKYLEAD